jgi:tryptophan 7-halogenase
VRILFLRRNKFRMTQSSLKHIVILGGGTSGWMTAAALAHFLIPKNYSVTLVESESIGTVGVGEATLPHLRFFNQTLGIDEKEFMQATHATYKMGIQFSNWAREGDAYIHPFGDYGREILGIGFHHYWLKKRMSGDNTPIDAYSLPVMAAADRRFMFPSDDERSIFSTYSYAFHLDAGLYAKYLRNYSETRGVKRIEGKVESVKQNDEGFIESLLLDNGLCVEGDFFIDCSGFRGILIEQTLKTGYDSWQHWLPCDRAVAIPCETRTPPLPYTKAIARSAGWQWRIPLQHRTGNGYVYASDYLSDDEACATLLANLDGNPIAEPNFLRFTAGKRNKAWNKNCVAIGLSGGFLEPLESTSIYLIQIGIMKLIEFFPETNVNTAVIDEFNRLMDMEYWRVRDFLILHYHATERCDTPFWNYCREMKIPEELTHKMTLFRERGYVVQYQGGLFLEPSWVAVYMGQRFLPQAYDPRVDRLTSEQLTTALQEIRELVNRAVADMPRHEQILFHQQEKNFAMPSTPSAKMSLYGVRS